LITEEQFGEIVVKALPDGSVTTLKDVARIELGAGQYSLRSLLNNKSAVAIPVSQAPGAEGAEQELPRRRQLRNRLRPDHFRA
jgi:multidrug efflux pump subunit AcrB